MSLKLPPEGVPMRFASAADIGMDDDDYGIILNNLRVCQRQLDESHTANKQLSREIERLDREIELLRNERDDLLFERDSHCWGNY